MLTYQRKLGPLLEFRMAKQKKTRRWFTEKFRAETEKLIKQSDRSISSISMKLGINAKSIGEWKRRADEAGSPIEEDERAELKRLRKTLTDRRHPDHEHIREWLGGGYDPEHFVLRDA